MSAIIMVFCFVIWTLLTIKWVICGGVPARFAYGFVTLMLIVCLSIIFADCRVAY